MSELERIEYLLATMRDLRKKMDVQEANKHVLSYKWLVDTYERKLKEEEDGDK